VDDDRLIRLQSTVDELQAVVRALERRIGALEGRAAAGPSGAADAARPGDQTAHVASAVDVPPTEAAAPDVRGWHEPIFVLSLIGRLFIVLGGGFFLRAMTDAGVFAPPVGVALGFAYGLVWLVWADRAAARGEAPSAAFHAIAAAMVAFPLLVEATTRFKVLSGMSSAGMIAVLTAGLLLVASRRRLQSVAWVTVVVALPTSVWLVSQTGVAVPFAFYLIAFGVATLWMGYALDWRIVRWPVAFVADLLVMVVTTRTLGDDRLDAPAVAICVQLSLLIAYLISIAIRTLVRGRNVVPFEVAQTMAALVIGFGGAVLVTRATGALPTLLGLSSLVCGAACYAVAYVFIDRRADRGRNVYFYTTLGLVLLMVGAELVLGNEWLGIVFAALAVVSSGLWSRVGRLFMLLHAAAYIVAAAVASDTVAYCAWAVAAGPVGPWAPPTGVMLVVLAAAAITVGLATVQPPPDGSGSAYASGPRFAAALVLVLTAGGCAIGYLAPIVGGSPNHTVDLGVLATLRTVVLALAALAVAWIGRHQRFHEWSWLVYPLLVGIGLKMVAQDFMNSRPATLFLALAVYGTALIVAPRMRRTT
jgi:hypothetical protein